MPPFRTADPMQRSNPPPPARPLSADRRLGVRRALERRASALWRNVHLYLGAGLALLLVPIALSGSLLVWHDELDAWMHPGRYAVSEGAPRPASDHLAAARAALGPAAQPVVVRFGAGGPATVAAREPAREGGRPRLLTAYLDPPSARVLDVVDFRASFVGVLHRFHENLTVPEYNGRAVVGWAGVAMLIMALTGLYLWWPPREARRSALTFRRGATFVSNLHHLAGIAVVLPLAVVSLTGIYLGFPQQGRALLSSLAKMTPAQRGAFAAPLMREPRLDIDAALAAALATAPGAAPAAIFLPGRESETWRVQVRRGGEVATVLVDDRNGEARAAPPPASGDRIAAWIRWIHEGGHAGPVWRVLVFLSGIAPPVLAVTGIMVWLGRRSRRAAIEQRRAVTQMGAAE